MVEVARLVRAAAAADVTVLLEGETGTGKEVVARAIAELGGRCGRPFVAINCSALTEAMLDAELFGHRRGAFTGAAGERPGLFAAAHGGTVFLDEIATTSPAFQARLLRVLENAEIRAVGADHCRPVDVRVVAASNVALEAVVARGEFRADLFYRLSVFPVQLPPLRARVGDIVMLAEHFVRELAGRARTTARALEPEALARLGAYDFPGNVRELRNEILRAVTLAHGCERIALGHLSARVRERAGGRSLPVPRVAPAPADAMRDLERRLVREALEGHDYNLTRAARALGITRFGLRKRMRRLGVVVRRSVGWAHGPSDSTHCAPAPS
jgi:two-component system response regulator HupR/HoxA